VGSITSNFPYATKKYTGGLIGEYIVKFGKTISAKTTLMEIGTLRGGFIRFCSECWLTSPESVVVGVDVNPRGKYSDNVTMYKCNQFNTQGLIDIAEKHKFFDIIIDDASHQYKQTENCFKTLWSYVKAGGYYVVEDWTVIGSFVYDIEKQKDDYNISECDIIKKGNIPHARVNPKLAIAFFKKGAA